MHFNILNIWLIPSVFHRAFTLILVLHILCIHYSWEQIFEHIWIDLVNVLGLGEMPLENMWVYWNRVFELYSITVYHILLCLFPLLQVSQPSHFLKMYLLVIYFLY